MSERRTADEVTRMLKDVDRDQAKGLTVEDIGRQNGISAAAPAAPALDLGDLGRGRDLRLTVLVGADTLPPAWASVWTVAPG